MPKKIITPKTILGDKTTKAISHSNKKFTSFLSTVVIGSFFCTNAPSQTYEGPLYKFGNYFPFCCVRLPDITWMNRFPRRSEIVLKYKPHFFREVPEESIIWTRSIHVFHSCVMYHQWHFSCFRYGNHYPPTQFTYIFFSLVPITDVYIEVVVDVVASCSFILIC